MAYQPTHKIGLPASSRMKRKLKGITKIAEKAINEIGLLIFHHSYKGTICGLENQTAHWMKIKISLLY